WAGENRAARPRTPLQQGNPPPREPAAVARPLPHGLRAESPGRPRQLPGRPVAGEEDSAPARPLSYRPQPAARARACDRLRRVAVIARGAQLDLETIRERLQPLVFPRFPMGSTQFSDSFVS